MSILHLLPLVEESLGAAAARRILDEAKLAVLPPEDSLCNEQDAAGVHQILRRHFPQDADHITRRAGQHTADWILATRMPPVAARTMCQMPEWLAGPLLCGLIHRHAWTFAGSGNFQVLSRSPPVFQLNDNPVVRNERASTPICSWHAGILERLFTGLVNPQLTCVETACTACGDPGCRFEIR